MKKNPSKGFTLVELMVALTLSLLIIAALTAMYAGSRQTNRVQDAQSRLTEDGRFALGMLQRVISQAGFRPSSGTIMSDRISGTPTATSLAVTFTPDGTNIVDCTGSPSTSTTAVTATISYDSSARKLSCGGTDWIAPATATGLSGKSTEVMDFAFSYGMDTASAPATLDTSYQCTGGGDCVADSYVSTPDTAKLAQIVAVKVCMVLRSETMDTSIVKGTAAKNCSGTDITGSQTDNKIYRTFHSTILLKNR